MPQGRVSLCLLPLSASSPSRVSSGSPLAPPAAPSESALCDRRTHRQAFRRVGSVGCGKTTLVRVAAHAQKLRIVALMGETNGTPLQRTLEQIETVMQVRGVSFGKEAPPLLLLVCSRGKCELRTISTARSAKRSAKRSQSCC